jgi:chloride channel 7
VVASAAFGRCVPTKTVDAAAAPRMTCPDGQHNDVAAFILGLRDDVISAILSVDGTKDDFAADDGDGDANATAGSTTRPFAASSLFVALAATLATMPFACDLALPAGLFMPTILWGALLGSLFGAGARRVAAVLAAGDATASARVSPGAYAVVGATAALAGVFRSSISLVVIMLEGTSRVGYLVPLLVGVAVAVRVGDAINGASFYEEQLRAKGVPYLRHGDAGAPVRASEMAAGVVAADLVRGPPVCLAPKETVALVEAALRDTAHNGFPVVIPDDDDDGEADSGRRSGRLVGVVLRSQLMVLLARRAFVGRIGSSDDDAESVVDLESESALEAFYDDLDTDMRTFHHRKDFDDRTIACSGEAVARLGLTDDERAMRLDIASFMKIAPLAVQAECSAWRALGYFRAAGLRHLPVVDVHNRVVGMLTRADLAPNEGTD